MKRRGLETAPFVPCLTIGGMMITDSRWVQRVAWTVLVFALALGAPGWLAGDTPVKASPVASGGDYRLTWTSIDGGFHSVARGADGKSLRATAGQPDAGSASAEEGASIGGFWVYPAEQVFNDGFESGNMAMWSISFGGT